MDLKARIVYVECCEFKQVLKRIKCHRSLGKPFGVDFRARIIYKEHCEFKVVL